MERVTLNTFPKVKKQLEEQMGTERNRIIIGMATCGIAAGGQEIYNTVVSELAKRNLDVPVIKTGCIGMCENEVLLDVARVGEPRVTYGHMTADRVARIIDEHLLGGVPVEEWVVGRITDEDYPYRETGFYGKQRRVVLRNCGFIDPTRIEEYIARNGYSALHKVLSAMSREEVIADVKRSGLRGRGGGGFPTGMKWEFTFKAAGDKKYVVCNADEGDPGAFMDRSVLEGDPHAVIEGMIIAAFAIGADEGYIYVRAEYPLAIKHLKIAIAQAEELGLLGDGIMGTGFDFHLKIKEGAGAFVCGEETALLASIEGHRGMPRPRPPFPANKGLWGKPTNINNVETYANIPAIIRNGGDWYAAMGTERSKGSKVFALTGKIKNTGLAEVPMGITLREIVYDIGGGIQNDRDFKAVQIGGPSGGCIPKQLMDTPVDYDSLIAAGAMMGSGGLVVMDERTCMVDLAKFFLNFTQSESCGKCTPCREGTKRMLELLTRITEGKGTMDDLDQLKKMGPAVKDASLCGLGQTAPNPVLTTIRYFEDEYIAHIRDKKCPAGVCSALLTYSIDAAKCTGCTVCARNCPVGAITGERKQPHVIDEAKCIKCGACFEKCKFGAIIR